MLLDRRELETLSRQDLIEKALSLGVQHAEVLTRPELIDEIVSVSVADEHERRLARGLLGRARDLVARVVEKGLNMPDAASRLRTLAPPLSAWRRGPPPIASVSLAEVYARQGHGALALKVLDEVLEREPDHGYAQRLRNEVANAAASASARPPPTDPAPSRVASEPLEPCAEPPQHDRLVVQTDGGSAVLLWSLRPSSFAHALAQRPQGRLVLRLLHAEPGLEGPSVRAEDVPIDALAGQLQMGLSPSEVEIFAALGWRDGDAFLALATAQRRS